MNARHHNIKLWPHLTLVFIVCAALGGVAAALWMRHERTADAFSAPRAARVERVDGEVGLSRDLNSGTGDESEWAELTPNTPLTVGDRVYARDGSRAAVAFTGRNFATVGPDSALDVVTLSDRRTQLALRDGSAIFDIGALGPDELFEVATPYGAVDFQQPGLYQVGYNDDGSAFVSVLRGVAQVVGLSGSGQLSKGEMLTLLGQTAAQVALSRLKPDYAGGLVDDYYAYRYPDSYDGRYADYDAYLNDPDYYDPYNRYASYRHVPAAVPGAYDLDTYGDWQDLSGYGYAWSPRVEQGWAPYRDGYWMVDEPYGLTWVSNEPWGYAPYHYGRWVSANERWYWVPDGVNTQPSYAPALVAFLPAASSNEIGWVPLAPGERYAPAYYDANWQPHYVGGDTYAPERVINLGVPNGLTVVSVEDFGRPIDRRRLARFDPRAFEGTRPVLEPFSNALLRQASLRHAAERRGFALPPGLAKKLDSTQVYASAPPPKYRDDFARRFHVEAVPDRQRREKLKFDDERQRPAQAAAPDVRGFGEARGRNRGRRGEEQQPREREARARDFGHVEGNAGPRPSSPEQPQAERVAAARAEAAARGERAAQERQQAQAAREQQRANAQQQRFETRRQAEAQRQTLRQAEQQQRAQQATAQREQQQQQRSAQMQEMMRTRQAQQQQRQAQQQQRQAQQQQRRVERQQPQPRPAMQAPPSQARRQQQAPAGGPPSGGGGGRGQGQGHGGGKGKGKP